MPRSVKGSKIYPSLGAARFEQIRRQRFGKQVASSIKPRVKIGCPVETGKLRASITVNASVEPGEIIPITIRISDLLSKTFYALTPGMVDIEVASNVRYATYAYPNANGRASASGFFYDGLTISVTVTF